MYVASALDRVWLLNEQRKLHARSKEKPDYAFQRLWGSMTDPRNLRCAFARVSGNRGRRTAGIDGITVKTILAAGVDAFVADLRVELRSGNYRPRPVRRVLIPKAGQPGKTRPLGIPTVKDRVVQAAVKSILEPIFEADFFPTSCGFRPGKSVHEALERLRSLLLPRARSGSKTEPRLPYQWAIEGDIKGCFDHINHHSLMVRLRRRVADAKLARLVGAFLKAGVLAEEQLLRTDAGTPQGGILSPLLANIALSELDERYARHTWPSRALPLRTEPERIQARAESNRQNDRKAGRPIRYLVRYADDFIVLVDATAKAEANKAEEIANEEKVELAAFLKQKLDLELSESKTLVTPVTRALRFLGHHLRVRSHPVHGRLVSTVVVPKERSQRLREQIKRHFDRSTLHYTLEDRLEKLNQVLRGWCYFYRHAWGAKRVFARLDHYVWWTIYRWLQKRHPRTSIREVLKRYAWRKPGRRAIEWREGTTTRFKMATVRVRRFYLADLPAPYFA
jgi:group II intron reverse transcriptase/maturase